MDEKEVELKAKELALSERELALKERESDAKIKLDKRGLMFSSPLLIAAISTIFGTALGAGMQAYSSFNAEKNKSEASLQLERMKFEFSLVRNAFEEPERDDIANQLLFLADSGVIRDLDVEKIKSLAKNPGDLPTFSRLPNVEAEVSKITTGGTVVSSESNPKNVRVQPGVSSPVAHQINVGERVTVIGRGSDERGYTWYRISFDENQKQGWIAAQLLLID